MHALFSTDPRNAALMLQRLALVAVIFPHGAQKLLGWYGGAGYDASMAAMTQQGMPPALAFLIIMAESIGMLMLALGFFSRIAALGIGTVIVGAVASVGGVEGPLAWMGTQIGQGYAFHLLALALVVPLVIAGGGAASVDSLIARRHRLRELTWEEAAAPTW